MIRNRHSKYANLTLRPLLQSRAWVRGCSMTADALQPGCFLLFFVFVRSLFSYVVDVVNIRCLLLPLRTAFFVYTHESMGANNTTTSTTTTNHNHDNNSNNSNHNTNHSTKQPQRADHCNRGCCLCGLLARRAFVCQYIYIYICVYI